MDTTIRALTRFGLGARIGESESIADGKEWLRAQLRRPQPTLAGTELAEIASVLRSLREAQRAQDRERLMATQRRIRQIQGGELSTMLSARISSDTPYVERLVAFWSNHLCVSVAASRQVAALAGHYERTAIRPHVLGDFTDMVMASAKHPAMLFYQQRPVDRTGVRCRAARWAGWRNSRAQRELCPRAHGAAHPRGRRWIQSVRRRTACAYPDRMDYDRRWTWVEKRRAARIHFPPVRARARSQDGIGQALSGRRGAGGRADDSRPVCPSVYGELRSG